MQSLKPSPRVKYIYKKGTGKFESPFFIEGLEIWGYKIKGQVITMESLVKLRKQNKTLERLET